VTLPVSVFVIVAALLKLEQDSSMPRDDSLTPRDLVEKLDVLRVECAKCGRSGRYRVLKLAEQIGWDGKLMDWLYSLTKDCRKNSPGLSDRCHARCPDLPKVV
jgi:hypothetical protein